MRRFEDLPAWQAGRALVCEICKATRERPFSRDFGLCDQIRRAAVSITSNIAEGRERGTTRDLTRFLYIAKGSCGEVRSQLYLAQDLGYLRVDRGRALREEAAALSRQLWAWISSMKPEGHP